MDYAVHAVQQGSWTLFSRAILIIERGTRRTTFRCRTLRPHTPSVYPTPRRGVWGLRPSFAHRRPQVGGFLVALGADHFDLCSLASFLHRTELPRKVPSPELLRRTRFRRRNKRRALRSSGGGGRRACLGFCFCPCGVLGDQEGQPMKKRSKKGHHSRFTQTGHRDLVRVWAG